MEMGDENLEKLQLSPHPTIKSPKVQKYNDIMNSKKVQNKSDKYDALL